MSVLFKKSFLSLVDNVSLFSFSRRTDKIVHTQEVLQRISKTVTSLTPEAHGISSTACSAPEVRRDEATELTPSSADAGRRCCNKRTPTQHRKIKLKTANQSYRAA